MTGAQDTGWEIESFHSEVVIHRDTSVEVTETIIADFGNLRKHGIYRDIPVKYLTRFGNNLDVRFELNGVRDEHGQTYENQVTYSGNDVSIRIGDPDSTVSGINTYVISYEVKRVITTPQEKAELYWNVTGNDWPVPIHDVTSTVTFADGSIDESICFTGIYGSSSTNCMFDTQNNSTTFTAANLSPGDGLTIAVAMDQSQFTFPTLVDRIIWFLQDNWIYGLPIIVFFVMLRLYWQKGRDKQFVNLFHESDVVRTVPLFQKINALSMFHPPDDITPGEVGVVVDERVHSRDITATVIDLAVRGFLTIKEETKGRIIKRSEFTLTLVGKDETKLKSYEKSVLDMLFGTERKKTVSLSKLPSKAYKYLEDARNNLYKEVLEMGYFSGNPKSVRTKYLVAGIVIIFISVFAGSFFATFSGSTGVIVAGMLSGIIVILFSFFMPARTAKGRKVLAEVVGLREYVKVGAWRQKEYEKKNFFEETLPYTIAFGLATKFISAFKDAKFTKPDWYQTTGMFNPGVFVSSMDSLDSSLAKGISATRPKSASSGGSGFSGGGFSGGGFGGGGGGSW